jgi:hypothetical protein
MSAEETLKKGTNGFFGSFYHYRMLPISVAASVFFRCYWFGE